MTSLWSKATCLCTWSGKRRPAEESGDDPQHLQTQDHLSCSPEFSAGAAHAKRQASSIAPPTPPLAYQASTTNRPSLLATVCQNRESFVKSLLLLPSTCGEKKLVKFLFARKSPYQVTFLQGVLGILAEMQEACMGGERDEEKSVSSRPCPQACFDTLARLLTVSERESGRSVIVQNITQERVRNRTVEETEDIPCASDRREKRGGYAEHALVPMQHAVVEMRFAHDRKDAEEFIALRKGVWRSQRSRVLNFSFPSLAFLEPFLRLFQVSCDVDSGCHSASKESRIKARIGEGFRKLFPLCRKESKTPGP